MALRLLLPLLLLTATLLISQAQGISNAYPDCCLKHSEKPIPGNRVTSYRLQEPNQGCLLNAVVFATRKNMKICADPNDSAVQKLMQNLDKKVMNKKKDRKGQSSRPSGRPKQQKKQQV